jgi:hypothetical protein
MMTDSDPEAAAAERWLDQLDPATVEPRDGAYVRAVIAMSEAQSAAEDALRRAVAAARQTGSSWTALGAALGTTAEEVQRRFGE